MTILVPTDFSDRASHALGLACQIASRQQAGIRLLHVLEHPQGVLLNASGDINLEKPTSNPFIVDLIKSANESMDHMAKSCQSVDIIKDVHIGKPNTDLADNLVNAPADLIIMSYKGKGEPETIGKIPEKVIRMANCPVITIKSPTALDDLKTIVYGSNLSEKEKPVIEKLKAFQQWLQAEILVLKVFTTSNLHPVSSDWEAIREFIKQNEIDNCQPYFNPAPSEEEGIVKFAREHKADMIAVGTHGRKGLARLFSGSIAEGLSHHARLPVWTCNLKAGGSA
ncbi:MAG: universal stress protein [Cytophagales bacterium]|nr:universal stress protein [Cytophagales bacterium]